MTKSNKACDQVSQEIDRVTMARMLDLRDVIELIGDGLDDGTFAKQELIRLVEHMIVHLFM